MVGRSRVLVAARSRSRSSSRIPSVSCKVMGNEVSDHLKEEVKDKKRNT